MSILSCPDCGAICDGASDGEILYMRCAGCTHILATKLAIADAVVELIRAKRDLCGNCTRDALRRKMRAHATLNELAEKLELEVGR